MALKNKDVFSFFYDAQIRRYLLQFIRIFSLIKIESAADENGFVTQSNVAINFGDMKRMVGHILRENSENAILPSNMMSVWISGLTLDAKRRSDPFWVSRINVDERQFKNGSYTTEIGNTHTIERYMPVPYKLSLTLDIWTNNLTTKFQILEQILMIFNPSLQIQQNENFFDWTMMTEVELISINYSNKAVPAGVDDDREVATLVFDMPIWINPPAKVMTKQIIEQIVMNVHSVADMSPKEMNNELTDFDTSFLYQDIFTEGQHVVRIGHDGAEPNELLLLSPNSIETEKTWSELLDHYGEFVPDVSFVTLKTSGDIESTNGEVKGVIEFHPTDPYKLIFNVDIETLPPTLSSGPVNQFVNPLISWPGNNLPTAVAGQRYVLLNDIPMNTGTNPWGTTNAKSNDIIEFNGSSWFVSFNSSIEDPNQYIKSLSSYEHYTFTGTDWVHTYFGDYSPGYWRITLQKN